MPFSIDKCELFRTPACPLGQVQTKNDLPKALFSKIHLPGQVGKHSCQCVHDEAPTFQFICLFFLQSFYIDHSERGGGGA